MNLNDCKELFYSKCEEYNIPKPPITINKKLQRALGRVVIKSSAAQVQFSELLLTLGDEDIYQTVLHEFAHYYLYSTGSPNYGHTPEFRDFCLQIGCTHTGASNSLTTTPNLSKLKSLGYKYIVKCPTCGTFLGVYKTRCDKVVSAPLYICRDCNVSLVAVDLSHS